MHSIIRAEILLKWFWLQTNSFLKIWLLCVNFEKFTSINLPYIEKRWAPLDGRFIGVNFSKLTHNNQIFRNDFVCNHYHLCKFSAQTIECNIFTPYDFILLLFYITYIFFGKTYWLTISCSDYSIGWCGHLDLILIITLLTGLRTDIVDHALAG